MDQAGRSLLLRRYRLLRRELKALQLALKPQDFPPTGSAPKLQSAQRPLVRQIRGILAEAGRPCAREELVAALAGSENAFGRSPEHDTHGELIRDLIQTRLLQGLFTESPDGKIGLAEWAAMPPVAVSDSRVREVIARMHTEMAEPLTIAALAAGINVSQSRLSHMFRNATGMTPLEYLGRIRLAAASWLLRKTELSQKEILATTGIANRANFNRQFRKVHGTSPTEFRGQKNESIGNSTQGPTKKRAIQPRNARQDT